MFQPKSIAELQIFFGLVNYLGNSMPNFAKNTAPLRTTAQKMKFSIKDFYSKCDQIHSFLQIWSHLLKKSLIENFIFCAVSHKTVA